MIDVNEIWGFTIALHGLTGCELRYSFRYDETSGVRHLLVAPSGLKLGEPEPFVTGGIPRACRVPSIYPPLR